MFIVLIIALVVLAVALLGLLWWGVNLRSELNMYTKVGNGEELISGKGGGTEEEREELRQKALSKRLVDQQQELNRRQQLLDSATKDVGALQKQLKKEQERSAKLLLNVLPPNIVEELKTTGKSEPKSFNEVTVFFSDIVDFTRKTSFMDTNVVIQELNMIFTEFDRIFKKHGCERIKTIGDAYLAVSGMSRKAEPLSAANMLKAAQEAMSYVRKLESDSPYHWQMRMGIHTGRVSGGIVGSDKYIYDVFGDTINVAARMEQASEAMQINVSEATYAMTKDEFVFVARGQIETKGKGLVNMYFLKDNYYTSQAMTEEITRW